MWSAGLRWDDIDFGNARLTVRGARVAVDGAPLDSSPKTSSGLRVLPLTRDLATVLRRAELRQAEDAPLAGRAYRRSGFVVVDQLGSALHPETLSSRWEPAGAGSSWRSSLLSSSCSPAVWPAPVVLIPLAAAAAIVLVVLRPGVSPRGWATALVLGTIAALGGLLDWTAKGGLNNLVWALAQLPLMLLTLLAGWAIVGRLGWEPVGIGRTIVLEGRVRPALRGFLLGAFLAIPWALGNIVNGPFEGDVYRTFWQPLAAFQPGVAEEAWGRMFLIPALYLLFRNFATARTALVTSVVLGTFWFAFVHYPANPVATLLVGGIFMLPMTYLWLRRGLEVAIGFHVCADLVRFFAAYLAFKGLWFV